MIQRIRRRGPDGKDIVKDVDLGKSSAVPKQHPGGYRVSQAPRMAAPAQTARTE